MYMIYGNLDAKYKKAKKMREEIKQAEIRANNDVINDDPDADL